VSGMLPNSCREDKGFFAEKQADGGKIFLLSELESQPHYQSYPLFPIARANRLILMRYVGQCERRTDGATIQSAVYSISRSTFINVC